MKTALLPIDIQNDYFEGGKMVLEGAEQASVKAKKILDEFRNKNLPVVHIKHLSTRPGSTFFLPDTVGSKIHKNVEPHENEKVIIKNYPNSFFKTDLLECLKNLEVSELVICGMMTHMCVDATVRAAKDFGFDITLIGDACATKELEIGGKKVKAKEVQTAFLSALNGFYAKVVRAEEYLEY